MKELNGQFYKKLEKEIQPYFEKTGSHAFNHTKRIYNLAIHIAKFEKVDIDILKASTLLHDIARKKQSECKKEICHAEEGAKMARNILNKNNFPYSKINAVCYAISVHRYSKKLKPKTREAQILQDVDRLDALGAITIARIFDYGGKLNRQIHNPRLKPKKYTHNYESKSSFIHFYDKILKIRPKSFYTKKAQSIAKGRYNFVKQFVDRFIKEWKGEL